MLALLVLLLSLAAPPPPPPARLEPKAYEVVTLADGVHAFVWDDPLADPIEGNALFVIGDDDVLVVDTALFPSTAERMVDELRRLTDKPVRWVVNTHWHDDHHGGNQVYRAHWPQAVFVSHVRTRQDALEQSHGTRPENVARLRGELAELQRWLDSGTDADGRPLDAARRARVEDLLALYGRGVEELERLVAVPADVTFDERLVLHQGRRTIELLFLGRANTRGDVVVHLPHERVVATGDIVVHPIPFGFGSYYEEWVSTLAAIEALGAGTTVPGHGAVMRDHAYLHELVELLRDLHARVGEAVAEGATLAETQARVTLSDWTERLARGDDVARRSFEAFWVAPAVERAWRQAHGEPDSQRVR